MVPAFLKFSRTAAFYGEKYILLLGDKEKESRNPLLASVEEKTLQWVSLLRSQGKDIVFLSVEGNHFTDPEERCLRALELMNI